MMQAEKVRRGFARDARARRRPAVAGAAACRPRCAGWSAARAQAPALIEPAVKAIDAALTALDEARTHLEHALRVADYDPRELERIEERLFALRAAGAQIQRPGRRACRARAPLRRPISRLIDAGAERLAAARSRRRARSTARYRQAAEALSAARSRRRAKLDKAVNAELKPLKLERARFSTKIERRRRAGPTASTASSSGCSTNPGTRPGPLMKVASGGELARFLLALKVVLADRGSAPTLVFDEIDTGVGGAVADAIGARLARLAASVQVLAVTHAPQVAARADRHYLITKDALAQGQARRDPRHASSRPSAAARRSPACSPAPRSPTRRAPRPSG